MIGQKFYMTRGGAGESWERVTVAKVTAHRIILEGNSTQFNRNTLKEAGENRDKWFPFELEPINDETTKRYHDFLARKRLERLQNNLLHLERKQVEALTLEQLEAINSILESK